MLELSREISIEGRKIGPDHPCFIIAEMGINHNGNIGLAVEMIDQMAECGVDSVKFQTFKAEEFVSDEKEEYEYLSQGKLVRESQVDMFKRLEIAYSEFSMLFKHSRKRGLIPFSTPTENEAVDLLYNLDVGAFKIGSDDLVHTPLLKYVSEKNKPIILSSGMADQDDIDRAISNISEQGNRNIALLHCVSLYPTPDESLNLTQICSLQERYNCPVGFSDHSQGLIGVFGAVAMGAKIIEKHFTIDKNLPGPDHHFSADPRELKELVVGVRRMESAMGSAEISLANGELEMRKIARRSIVAAKDISIGDLILSKDLAYQRPGTGLMPYQADLLVGRRAKANIKKNDQINLDDLKEEND